MEIYIIEYKDERVAITNKYGCLEVECLRKKEGKRIYSNAEIFKFVRKIGDLRKNEFGGPTHGEIFSHSICEFYWYEKVPSKEKVEKICGKLKETKEFHMNEGDIAYYVKIKE